MPKPIDIEIVPPEPEMVIASQIAPDRLMLVAVTRSFSALAIDAGQDSVTNDFLSDLLVQRARVTVAFAGRAVELIRLSDGVYGSASTLQFPGEQYTSPSTTLRRIRR